MAGVCRPLTRSARREVLDHRENELSLQHGWRLLSAYTLSTGVKFWIITEADRSVTTFLLPEEY
jgi:hypothetical protein